MAQLVRENIDYKVSLVDLHAYDTVGFELISSMLATTDAQTCSPFSEINSAQFKSEHFWKVIP